MRRLRLNVSVFVLLAVLSACHHPPPTVVTAQGVTAFQNMQVQKALDTVRDIAIDANATTPPVVKTETTRKVITWHKTAITVLHARAQGWQGVLISGLDEIPKGLPASEQQVLAPYLVLAKTVITEVTK